MSRIQPKPSVVKKLFALSGNQCALPECSNDLVDNYGNLIGQICHIEAAEEGGPRYNKNQTDEERRAFENLILLCANHHISTNNISKYSREVLWKIKKDHESQLRSSRFSVSQRQALSFLGIQPHYFSPLEEIKASGEYRNLFNNGLIYQSEFDSKNIDSISEELKTTGICLLSGFPSEGKTIMSLLVGERLKEDDYNSYYISLKGGNQNLWEDVLKLENQEKNLFIIDDIHLDIDLATHFFERSVSRITHTCFLFVSRVISEPKTISPAFFGRINLYNELSSKTYSALPNEQEAFEIKVKGIIELYQLHYQLKYGRAFHVGGLKELLDKIGRDFHALGLFLKEWTSNSVETLSSIKAEVILNNFYELYHRKLSSQEQNCLLAYVSMGIIELAFEQMPTCKLVLSNLEENGFVISLDQGEYSFHHSATAELIMRSYWGKNLNQLSRIHKSFEIFIGFNLGRYIESISKEYQYPGRMESILRTLALKKKDETLHTLFRNEHVSSVIRGYFIDHGLAIRPSIFSELFLNYLNNKNLSPSATDLAYALQNAYTAHNKEVTELSIIDVDNKFLYLRELIEQDICERLYEDIDYSLSYSASINYFIISTLEFVKVQRDEDLYFEEKGNIVQYYDVQVEIRVDYYLIDEDEFEDGGIEVNQYHKSFVESGYYEYTFVIQIGYRGASGKLFYEIEY